MTRGAFTAKSTTLLFIFSGLATPQTPAGSIAGVIHDPSGAAVATAKARAVSTATGLARAVNASAQGDFSFPALLTGQYEVSVEAPGFQSMVRQTVKPVRLRSPAVRPGHTV